MSVIMFFVALLLVAAVADYLWILLDGFRTAADDGKFNEHTKTDDPGLAACAILGSRPIDRVQDQGIVSSGIRYPRAGAVSTASERLAREWNITYREDRPANDEDELADLDDVAVASIAELRGGVLSTNPGDYRRNQL